MERNLMQLNIQRAQEEIDRKKELVSKGSMRQEYHFMPQAGWMNDPNGLICFRGKYHFSISVILMVHFGTVCTGDMRSVKIWFTGNIFPWLLLQVSHMMIILRADAFPEAPLSVKISCS